MSKLECRLLLLAEGDRRLKARKSTGLCYSEPSFSGEPDAEHISKPSPFAALLPCCPPDGSPCLNHSRRNRRTLS